jgi:copper homeostasis protein
MSKKITVEICVDSVESAIAAQKGGADRVELCDNLMEGGTTPSFGAIEMARKLLDIKLHVIIRPRGGDFYYSDIEFEIIKRDVEMAKSGGVDGIVIGILDENGEVDKRRTAQIIELARPLSVTFHRAFDVAQNAFRALEDLISLGIDRILTSGQEETAMEGLDLIAEITRRADNRIIIMACGNLNDRNIAKFVEKTNVKEVHFTAFSPIESQMKYRNPNVFMGGTLRTPEYNRNQTDANMVSKTIANISKLR